MESDISRTIVVGDVHGCLEELKKLLEQCNYEEGKDRVVFVGDLVGKGPLSIEAVKYIQNLKNCFAVRGNHDQYVLDCREHKKKHGILPSISDPTHSYVVENLDEEGWKYLESLPLFLELEDLNIIVVHAGLVPKVELQHQDPHSLLNMRNLDELPWASLWKGPRHVIFGHDAVRGLQKWEFATGLDTGCCYGNHLTAVVLPERRFEKVEASRMYSQPTKPLIKQ